MSLNIQLLVTCNEQHETLISILVLFPENRLQVVNIHQWWK